MNQLCLTQDIQGLKKQLDKAQKAHQLEKEIRLETEIATNYFYQKEYRKSERFYKNSIRTNKSNEYPKLAITSYLGLAEIEKQKGKHSEELGNYKIALSIANSINDSQSISLIKGKINALNTNTAISKKQSDNINSKLLQDEMKRNELENKVFLDEIKYLSKENQLVRLKSRLKEKEIKQSELRINYFNELNHSKQLEIKQKNDSLLLQKVKIERQDIQNAKQKLLIWFAVLLVIILIVFTVYYFRINKQRLEHNKTLRFINAKLSKKNKEVTDSIRYAKKIQDATLLMSKHTQILLKDMFVLFQPKDIVSGDFYWVRTIDDKIFWAVVDCTGHGVPGAFMSMIGNSLLNEIIVENKIFDAHIILDELKLKVVNALNLDNTIQTKDGMDLSICVFDLKTKFVEYAGANNSIYIVKDKLVKTKRFEHVETKKVHLDDLIELKPNRFPVGYSPINSTFSSVSFQVEKNDMIYMFSDGYADQFGGEKNKKFTYKRLKDLFVEIHHLPLEEQSQILEKNFLNWKGEHEQIDDVCVVGVRI